jgi:hypothetical protein
MPKIASNLMMVLLLAAVGFSSAQQASNRTAANGPGRDSLTVQALRAAPGKPSLYELTFVTTDTLRRDAEIVVTFPNTFDLSQLQIAGSNQINGGFKLERRGQEARLRRSGLGETIPPGRKVSVQLGLIVNPPSFSSAHQVRVAVANSVAQNKEVQFKTIEK